MFAICLLARYVLVGRTANNSFNMQFLYNDDSFYTLLRNVHDSNSETETFMLFTIKIYQYQSFTGIHKARQLHYVTELSFDVYSRFYQLPVTWSSCTLCYFFRWIIIFCRIEQFCGFLLGPCAIYACLRSIVRNFRHHYISLRYIMIASLLYKCHRKQWNGWWKVDSG